MLGLKVGSLCRAGMSKTRICSSDLKQSLSGEYYDLATLGQKLVTGHKEPTFSPRCINILFYCRFKVEFNHGDLHNCLCIKI